MAMDNIKKVHVVYKTHLDVGFTDMARNVVDNYINNFIPRAISLANSVNREGEPKKFVWTVGSWLIDEYLRRTDGKEKKALIDAINKGYVTWHGLPFTTHSELMDQDLFEYGISISKQLDKTFRKNTIAAKMTDVPGHTRGIIHLLSNNGIKYLHIGVNGVSHKPDVYDTFVWKDSNGKKIIVDYCQGYGKTSLVPGFDEAMVLAASSDNFGPPSKENIDKQLKEIQAQFPGAVVEASTLDNYARALLKIKDKLPVVTDEIGDTWIHGVASDPFKVSAFLELLRIKNRWLGENKIKKDSSEYREFMRYLLMIPEHTWGLDFKKYLADYKNWRKEDFQKARRQDILQDAYIPDEYKLYGDFARNEFKAQIKNMKWDERRYSYFESSHEEQRKYILSAIETLPSDLKQEAQSAVNNLRIFPKEDSTYQELTFGKAYNIGSFETEVLPDASIKVLLQGAEKPIILGKISYQLFGTNTYKKWEKEYMVNSVENKTWAIPDFLKPGIEDAGIPAENSFYSCDAQRCFIKGNELIIRAGFNGKECSEYGCPRDVIIKYIINGREIQMNAYFSGKDASRLPEALWISHFTGNCPVKNVQLLKLGEIIDPFKVVKYGNRNYHAVEKVLFKLGKYSIGIVPMDSKIVSPGEMRLYDFNQQFANPYKGFHFNLYNNLWGTNFKMWYDEDIISRFKITID